jgi:hypothetical protein
VKEDVAFPCHRSKKDSIQQGQGVVNIEQHLMKSVKETGEVNSVCGGLRSGA